MKIIYLGGEIAGGIGLSACFKHEIVAGIAYPKFCFPQKNHPQAFKDMKSLVKCLDLPSINEADLLLCVHGREWVPKEIRELLPCVNVHPFNKDKLHTVTSHYMTNKLDKGKIIYSSTLEVKSENKYDDLYPTYFEVVYRTLEILCIQKEK